jgi:hypothetical protein
VPSPFAALEAALLQEGDTTLWLDEHRPKAMMVVAGVLQRLIGDPRAHTIEVPAL